MAKMKWIHIFKKVHVQINKISQKRVGNFLFKPVKNISGSKINKSYIRHWNVHHGKPSD